MIGKHFAFGAMALLTLASCDNTLDVTAPFENVPIVYATLDPNSDTQYVRIGRAYLGQDGPNGGLTHPDSVYYPALVARIQAFRENGQLAWEKTLEETYDIPKDSGLFTTQGHRLYRLLVPGFTANASRLDWTYKLVLQKDSTSPVFASSITPLVKYFSLKKPTPIGIQRLNLTSTKGQEIEWNQAVNARGYQGYIDFLYMEMPEHHQSDSTRHIVRYYLPYQLGSTLNGGATSKTTLTYQGYYQYLAESLDPRPGYIRFFRGFTLHLNAGTDDLATYISVTQPSNTILQDPPFFTNIMGGAGIFASQASLVRPNLGLADRSLDSLVFGKLTCELRFAKASFLDTLTCN
ncbi:MAG TPA: hypothetical protein DCE13_01580 [Cryomorphaceae bacterium]|jgi:hypothetical protein|nr:MAG: hypothetical protein ABR98_05970 [Cryomorphaceae bacterium BACL7 MAG-120910-bin2]KRO69092.1 MAG: hypothetical protein ABR88_02250 [Cryomorphaceae bacterium BACL7 MAG-120322-bin74]KRO82881.1 MAG: hypothetical protein ABR87_07215 [Cryomorphaceae bacterium BACL7 MAG-121220-bin83]HAB31211.1 hypothetical protein [Cryomorphaceae bacterium]